MRKYYTRACNFYHGKAARNLIHSKKAFPLNGKKDIAFDKIEIFIREKDKVNSKIILCKDIKKLKQLKELFDDGVLTEEEFQKAKNKIINK